MDVDLMWLLLSQWPGISRRVLRQLIESVKTPDAILSLSDEACLRAGIKPEWLNAREAFHAGRPPGLRQAEHQLQQLSRMGAKLLAVSSESYPALLKEIPDAPPVLFAAGNDHLLAEPQLAVVGSRNASRAGLALAESFSADLAGRGLCISSGLAYGIDSASHRGALKAGGGTIAVLGTGLDVVYPRRNQQLYEQIAGEGLLLSEFPPGTPPRREQFPQRNRIISGLSLGVLVVEAALRSGSLITARFALEQGRDVFAIPGSIHNPMARGCHELIRNGACLVESSRDIIDAWSGWLVANPVPQNMDANFAAAEWPQSPLLEQMGYEPLAVDELAALTGSPVDLLMSELLSLELEGWVEQRGARWCRSR